MSQYNEVRNEQFHLGLQSYRTVEDGGGVQPGLLTQEEKEEEPPCNRRAISIELDEDYEDNERNTMISGNEDEAADVHFTGPSFAMPCNHSIYLENTLLLSREQTSQPNKGKDASGTATPCSLLGQGDESEYESSEDECGKVDMFCNSLLRSNISARKKLLYVEISKAFWNMFPLVVTKHMRGILNCGKDASESTSNHVPQYHSHSQSTSSSSTTSTTTKPFISHTKRKSSDDEDYEDRRKGSKQPIVDPPPEAVEKQKRRFACPFRKHNPQKYNIQSKWKTCATNSFENVARTK
jgi:hypothetical protein